MAYVIKKRLFARALFVITKEGIIHWRYISPIGINLGAAGILKALESLDFKDNNKNNNTRSVQNKNNKTK